MTKKGSQKKKLNYFPEYEVSSMMSPQGGVHVVKEHNSSDGALVAGVVVLVLLLLLIMIGAIVYWGTASSSGGCFGEGKKSPKKSVTIDERKNQYKNIPARSGGKKELKECSEQLLKQIMSGKNEDAVILAFVSPGCGHCETMKPALKNAAKKSEIQYMTLTYGGNKKYIEEVVRSLGISGFPTLVKVQDNGKGMIMYQGDRSEQSLEDFGKDE